MSLVERALEKIQAGERAKRAGAPASKPIRDELARRTAGDSRAAAGQTRLPPPVNTNRLVKVDCEALRTSGLLPAPEQEQELTNQYRAIKRPLLSAAFHSQEQPEEGPLPRLIMITSALPGDGKTFTALNLALSMAREADHSVVLVDGDVIKPQLSTLFGIDRDRGLLDVLANPALDVRSAILPTDMPGLSVMPAGTRSDTANELLASARMNEVMEQLAGWDPHGIVLFDSLPVLLTSEAHVLATLMGQIVLVVKAGDTPQQAVADALVALGADKRVSLVLNQAASDSLGYGYRYGSHYRYRNPHEAPAPEVSDSA